jgi:hypothetical protein
LTVKVRNRRVGGANDLPGRVIKVELFRGFDLRRAAVGYKSKLRVAYNTFAVEPDGAEPAVGNADEWKRPERLGHIITQLNKLFERQENLRSQAEWISFNAGLNAVIAQGTANAVRNHMATEAAARQFLGGR